MKVVSVTIQGMHNVGKKTYKFGNLNYLRGPNGAGKTTVMQAIQFALFGYIPGQNATNEAVFSHSNGIAMQVKLVLDDDGNKVIINRTIQKAAKSISSRVEIEPDCYSLEDIIGNVELPVFKFNELLALSPNKLKEWFISYLPATKDSLVWRDALSRKIEDLKGIDKDALVDDECKVIDAMNLLGLEEVKAANQHFKECVSFYKGKVASSQTTIQSLIMYDDVSDEYTEEDIAAQLESVEKERRAIHAYTRAVDTNNRLRDQISKLGTCSDSLESDEGYTDLLEEEKEVSSKLKELRDRHTSLLSELEDLNARRVKLESVIFGKGVCQYTDAVCPSIASKLPEYESEMGNLLDTIKQHMTRVRQSLDTISDTESHLKNINSMIRQFQERYSHRDIIMSQMVEVPKYEPARSDQECEVEISRLVDLLSKVKANKRYNQLVDQLTNEKFQNELTLEAYKRWAKMSGENGVQTVLMNKPFEEFAVKISSNLSRFFGSNVRAQFNLVEKANSFNFGLYKEDEDVYIPFNLLSSGEKCLYTIAFMIAILNSSDSKLTFVMIDDMLDHLDDDNINRMFDALKNVSDIQFLFAGVKDCSVENKETFIQEVINNG